MPSTAAAVSSQAGTEKLSRRAALRSEKRPNEVSEGVPCTSVSAKGGRGQKRRIQSRRGTDDDCKEKAPSESNGAAERKTCGIQSFFKRFSKEEYIASVEKARSVVLVSAMVHVPSGRPSLPLPVKATKKRRRRHASSNMAVSGAAADKIEVVECEDIMVGGGGKQIAKPDTMNTASMNGEIANVNSPSTDESKERAEAPKADDKVSDVQQKSPELFKPTKQKRPKNKRILNYDSDSIDIDVLSKIVDKTCSRENNSSCDVKAADAFTVLMSSPLSDSYGVKEKPAATVVAKAVEEVSEEKITESNNAFLKLMAGAKRRRSQASEENDNADVNRVGNDNTEEAVLESAESSLEPAKDVRSDCTSAPEVAPNGAESKCNRRRSLRIRKSRIKMEEEPSMVEELPVEPEPKKRKKRVKADTDPTDDEVQVVTEKVKKRRNKKLAPIFTGKKTLQEDPERVTARKAFLLSSAPVALRSLISKGGSTNDTWEEPNFCPFSDIGHITQISSSESCEISRPKKELSFMEEDALESVACDASIRRPLAVGAVSKLKRSDLSGKSLKTIQRNSLRMRPSQIFHFANSLKMLDESFPCRMAFRRYVERKIESDTLEAEAKKNNLSVEEIEEKRLRSGRLRKRAAKTKKRKLQSDTEQDVTVETVKFDPLIASSLQWTSKYAPRRAEDVIGNWDVVQSLQTWLKGWMDRKRKKRKPLRGKPTHSSRLDESDDFIASSSDDECFEDSSSDDDSIIDGDLQNTALLTGPNGVGKTSCVYALAHSLGFRILEVNASSLRGGKQVMAQLHEATQSHHVSKPGITMGKHSRAQAPSKHIHRTALILFEDIDIAFEEEDDGFYNAVNSIIATTKRPIVLTSSHRSVLTKKLLKQEPRQFVFRPVSPECTARYLQLLCLAEGFPVDHVAITGLVTRNGGMVSKSILELQFWAMSGTLLQSLEAPAESCNPDCVDQPELCMDSTLDDSKQEIEESQTSSLAALMSVSPASGSTFRPVRPMKDCLLGIMGVDTDERVDQEGVSEFARRLCKDGYASIVEEKYLERLPFLRCQKNQHGGGNTAEKRFKRIIAFGGEEGEGEEEGCAQVSEEKIRPYLERIETDKRLKVARNARLGLEAISFVAEAISDFTSTPRSDPWWADVNHGAPGHPLDSVRNEVFPDIQLQSFHQSSKEISRLLDGDGQVGDELSLPSEEANGVKGDFFTSSLTKSVVPSSYVHDTLNGALGDVTTAPSCHAVDTLAVLRGMARTEQRRRKSGGKKSRSGRFLHYFDLQEIHFEEASLKKLCAAFTS